MADPTPPPPAEPVKQITDAEFVPYKQQLDKKILNDPNNLILRQDYIHAAKSLVGLNVNTNNNAPSFADSLSNEDKEVIMRQCPATIDGWKSNLIESRVKEATLVGAAISVALGAAGGASTGEPVVVLMGAVAGAVLSVIPAAEGAVVGGMEGVVEANIKRWGRQAGTGKLLR